ncbi:hypothetical protein PCE1_002050 [Barthelona sp. PCE]
MRNVRTENQKNEVDDLKKLIRDALAKNNTARKIEVLKKVINIMVLGVDLSDLFSDVLMLSVTPNIMQKKLAYHILIHYASSNPKLAVMSVDSMQKDCSSDFDPSIRGLALRSLTSLNAPSVLDYLAEPIQHGFTDRSGYVRRTAVIGALKLFHYNPSAFEANNFMEDIINCVNDRDPRVAVTAAQSIIEIQKSTGGSISSDFIIALLNRAGEMADFLALAVLDLIPQYTPAEEEIFPLMNAIETVLSTINPAVVVAGVRAMIWIVSQSHDSELLDQAMHRLRTPLITLGCSNCYTQEIRFSMLKHILTIVRIYGNLFEDCLYYFTIMREDPNYIRIVKLQIFEAVVNGKNRKFVESEVFTAMHNISRPNVAACAVSILPKLIANGSAVDSVFRRIGMILASKITPLYKSIFATLPALIQLTPQKLDYLKSVLLPIFTHIPHLNVPYLNEFIGLLPYIAPVLPDAIPTYLLEELLEHWSELDNETQALLVPTVYTMFFVRAGSMGSVVTQMQNVLVNCKNTMLVAINAHHIQLMNSDPHQFRDMLLSTIAPVEPEIFLQEKYALEQANSASLFDEFNSFAVVMGKPSDFFLQDALSMSMVDDELLKMEETTHTEPEPEQYTEPEPEQFAAPQPKGVSLEDLLDFGAPATAAPVTEPATFDFDVTTEIEMSAFQEMFLGMDGVEDSFNYSGTTDSIMSVLRKAASGTNEQGFRYFGYAHLEGEIVLVYMVDDTEAKSVDLVVKCMDGSKNEPIMVYLKNLIQ